MKDFFGTLTQIALALSLAIYLALTNGFVYMKAYEWLVLPAMPNLPIIAYWHFVGLISFWSLINTKMSVIKEEYQLPSRERYSMGLLKPWMALIIAWIVCTIIS